MSGFANIEWMKVVNKKTLKCITLQKQLWNHRAFLLQHLFSLLLSRPLIYWCGELFLKKKVGAMNTNCWSWRPCSRLTLYWLLVTAPKSAQNSLNNLVFVFQVSKSTPRASLKCSFRCILTFLLVGHKVTVWTLNVSGTLEYTWNRMENA